METNWRPIQGGEPAMDSIDWRTQLQPDSRQRIVNKIMDTLKKHLPFSGQEGLHELKKIAERFEEKIYTAATSQSDYLRKISLKMLTMETKSQNPMPSGLPFNPAGPNNRPPPDPASLDSTAQIGHVNEGDMQEEVYQKIKAMKEQYLPELNEMYQKINAKLQQHESLPQQPKAAQYEKISLFKTMLERAISFLQVPKSGILPGYKEKSAHYEKQIVNFINTNRPRRPQVPSSHMHTMQQPQSQISQVQSHENHAQGSVGTMQQNNITNLQQNSLSTLSGVSTPQQNMMNSMQQPSSNIDSGQGNALNTLQQVSVGSMQQNPVSAPQQASINAMSSQIGMNVLQSNINTLQPNSGMLQNQHLKQQQEQQMLQSQPLKQQFHHQLMQKQQQQQQQQHLQQQAKPQLPAQMQTHQNQMSQLHQMNDVNDLKIRQSMVVKPGVFQQHLPAGQCSSYTHQQLNTESPFSVPSNHLQASSPQVLQHSSPQVDQQNLAPSLTKTGTPLQSASSPFVVPSPSTPLAPSPMPGDSEKPMPGVSSLSHAGNVGQQAASVVVAPAPSLAIGTPGISASPLLAEFSGPDGTHGNNLASVSGKSSVTEQPLDRLIKVANHALLEEIREINQRLIDTVVDISDEDVDPSSTAAAVEGGEGTIVKCSFSAVALSPNFKSQYASARMSPIQPLRLLVPTNYPNCFPVLLDKFPVDISKEYEDLSVKAKSKFSISLRGLVLVSCGVMISLIFWLFFV